MQSPRQGRRCDARRCRLSGPNALPAQRACRGCCGKFLGLACCQRSCADDFGARQRAVTPSGLEPTPLRYGAVSRRLRPLGQIVLDTSMRSRLAPCAASHRGIGAFASRVWHSGLPQCIFCSRKVRHFLATGLALRRKLRTPGVEPGSLAWEACVALLLYVRHEHRAICPCCDGLHAVAAREWPAPTRCAKASVCFG